MSSPSPEVSEQRLAITYSRDRLADLALGTLAALEVHEFSEGGSHFPQPLFRLMVNLEHQEGPPVEFSKVTGPGPNDRSPYGHRLYLLAVATLTSVCSLNCLVLSACTPDGLCLIEWAGGRSTDVTTSRSRVRPIQRTDNLLLIFSTMGNAVTLGLFCDVG